MKVSAITMAMAMKEAARVTMLLVDSSWFMMAVSRIMQFSDVSDGDGG